MSYKISAKNRKFKGKIIKVLRALKFRGNNSSTYFKLIFMGNMILIISLFMNWSYSLNNELQNTAFSILSGFAGYILILLSLANLFLILSNKKKESLKLHIQIKINETSFIIFSAIMQLIIVIIVLFFIRGLLTFSENIIIGKGIIFAFLGIFLNLAGAIYMYREYDKNNENILFSNDTNGDENITNAVIDKNNMKLPF